jgi:hypothetical protein
VIFFKEGSFFLPPTFVEITLAKLSRLKIHFHLLLFFRIKKAKESFCFFLVFAFFSFFFFVCCVQWETQNQNISLVTKYVLCFS